MGRGNVRLPTTAVLRSDSRRAGQRSSLRPRHAARALRDPRWTRGLRPVPRPRRRGAEGLPVRERSREPARPPVERGARHRDICYQVDLDTTAEIAVLGVKTTGALGIDMVAGRTVEVN